jgi:hypothetical protein
MEAVMIIRRPIGLAKIALESLSFIVCIFSDYKQIVCQFHKKGDLYFKNSSLYRDLHIT